MNAWNRLVCGTNTEYCIYYGTIPGLESFTTYLTLPVTRMIQRKWIKALKLIRMEQDNSLVPGNLTKEVLLFIIMNRRNISRQADEKEIRSQCSPVHFLLYICKPVPLEAKEVFNYIFSYGVIEHLLQV